MERRIGIRLIGIGSLPDELPKVKLKILEAHVVSPNGQIEILPEGVVASAAGADDDRLLIRFGRLALGSVSLSLTTIEETDRVWLTDVRLTWPDIKRLLLRRRLSRLQHNVWETDSSPVKLRCYTCYSLQDGTHFGDNLTTVEFLFEVEDHDGPSRMTLTVDFERMCPEFRGKLKRRNLPVETNNSA